MSVERSKRIPTLSEIRAAVKARDDLRNSKTPQLFEWIRDSFPGTDCSVADGVPGDDWPSASLHAVWTRWNSLGVGGGKQIRSSAEITVGFTDTAPFIDVTHMYEMRVGKKHVDQGSRTRRVKPAIMAADKPFLQIVVGTIKETRLLNPNGEEIDIVAVQKKAEELSSL